MDSHLLPPPTVVGGLVVLQVAYLLFIGPLRARIPRSAEVSPLRRYLFSQGVVTLFLALASPLHVLSDQYLFTAHMAQHLLITMVAAPLLLAGTPGWLFDAILERLRLRGVARALRHPVLAFSVYNLVFALAHLPPLYESALAAEAPHAAEHLLFLAAALVHWAPILSPSPRYVPRYHTLGQVLYFFAQTVPASLLGALLASANRSLYPTYANAPRLIADLSPLADQQVGGLLMWVGGGTYYLVATAIVFFLWAAREEAASRRPARAT